MPDFVEFDGPAPQVRGVRPESKHRVSPDQIVAAMLYVCPHLGSKGGHDRRDTVECAVQSFYNRPPTTAEESRE